MIQEILYYNILLFLILFSFTFIRSDYGYARVISVPHPFASFFLLLLGVWSMASIPVVFGFENDRLLYAMSVQEAQRGELVSSAGEVGFIYYTRFISKFVNYEGWFYVTALIYIGNYLWSAYRLTKEYMFVLFLTQLSCFQFFSYGTNTIRAGFAASFVVLAITFRRNLKIMIPLLIYAYYAHHSMMIPIAAIVLSHYFKKTKWYIWGWFACIVLSFLVGNYFGEVFKYLVEDSRSSYFVTNNNSNYKTGFRLDFLLYSSIPVILGYYYIFKLKCRSEWYQWLYRVYLAANSFWVLVIRANFTDRFAYLSWFLFPIVLLYPLLNQQLYLDIKIQRRNIISVMIFIAIFGYYMRFK